MEEPELFKTQKLKIPPYGIGKDEGKRACLVIISGANIGKIFFIHKKITVIGRAEDVDVRIDELHVSKRHAQLISEKDKVSILDLKSTNGTFVNLEPVSDTEERVLIDGDKILIGNINMKFLFRDETETAFQEELYELASHDGLTDAYNKIYFMKALEERRRGKLLSLIMFDLDFLKKINDTYGHPAGDFVLKELVDIVKGIIREEDVFARYGGEEFIILMERERRAAYDIAERIRETVGGHKFIFRGKEISCTISLGVLGVSDFSLPLSQWIESVDKLLYKAKAAGRNKTCCDFRV